MYTTTNLDDDGGVKGSGRLHASVRRRGRCDVYGGDGEPVLLGRGEELHYLYHTTVYSGNGRNVNPPRVYCLKNS